jgi:nucleoside-diphosphate-sugar epimerase
MRYLVTGATSFLGAPLVQQLLDSGHPVKELTDDIRDGPAVSYAAKNCDSIIHLAYAPAGAPGRDVLDVAVRGMLSVLGACEQQNVRELMLVSSPLADDLHDSLEPAACYGAGKRISETMAAAWAQPRSFPRRVIIARPSNVYGPGMGTYHVIPQFILRMQDLIRAGRKDPLPFPIRGTGRQLRSFIYVDDCATQLHTLLKDGAPGVNRYDVGTRNEQSIADVAQAVAACFGRTVEVHSGSSLAEDPDRRLPYPPRLLSDLPHVSFERGLEITVKWYQEHPQEDVSGRST